MIDADRRAAAKEIARVMATHADVRYVPLYSTRVRAAGAILKLSRSTPQTLFGVGGDEELQRAILDALPEGWTYRRGWWSPREAAVTVRR